MLSRNVRGTCGPFALAAAACLLCGSGQAQMPAAEVAALSQAYGAGVHAYFANEHQRAYDDLTQAIEAGSRDPRAWYFRGLAALKLGRLDEAEADFSVAADKEAEAAGDWDVSRSLERVQGHDRLQLERHRIRARVVAYQQRTSAIRQRYIDAQRRQPDVLRQIRPETRRADPLGLFTGDDEPAETVPAPAASEPDADPVPSDDEPVMPAEEPAEAEETPADEPLAEEPLAEEPGAESEDPPAEETSGDNPFAN